MRLGKLNRKIEFFREEQTGTSPIGSPIVERVRYATEWAELVHNSEDEKFAATQKYAERIVTFRLHYRPDVTETDEIEYDGAVYNIQGQRELGFREGLEIKARWLA